LKTSKINWTQVRHHLHANPELAFKEKKTALYISELLQKLPGISLVTNLGKTGILATLDSGGKGNTILFRAELDALPLKESNNLTYRSKVAGISHLCGHDGHMAILLATVEKLSLSPPKKGKIHFIFQPAEETGQGALAILNDPKFKDIEINSTFALHNLPGYPLGQIVLRNGIFNACVRSMIIKLEGKTAHAAQPQLGINPAVAISHIISGIDKFTQSDESSENFALVVPIYVQMGEKTYGTSAGHGEVHFTLRTWTEKKLDQLAQSLTEMVERISNRESLKCTIEWTESFTSIINDDEQIDLVKQAAQSCGLPFLYADRPFTWGEDFGHFTSKFGGAFFGIGAGIDQSPLHHPEYQFSDELIEKGASVFEALARLQLNQS
jgi:amidohydrolase